MTITQSLQGEHGAINALLHFIENRAPEASAEQLGLLAEVLGAVLLSHAAIEDELLVPQIRPFLPPAPGGPGAPTDHQVIASLLHRTEEAGDGAARRRLLLETVAETRKHFTKEETKIFPIAERELPAETQRALASEWADRRAVCIAPRLPVPAEPSIK